MNRRTFIITSASVAGGIAVGGYYLVRPETTNNPLKATLDRGQTAITPYVIIDERGVTIITPRAEMGQGIHGTLAALVAEELDIAVSDIRVEHGPASEVYANNVAYPPLSKREQRWQRVQKRLGAEIETSRFPQLTGGQSSIQDAFVKMRKAGAAARIVLLEAAATTLGVDVSDLTTANGAVVQPDGTALPYTSLAAAAAGISPPPDPPLKPREAWTQLGRSQGRVDMVAKCTGTAAYSIDVQLPDMVYATVLLNPYIGGGVRRFDDSRASEMPGFLRTEEWRDGIIVFATNTWYALSAAKKIDVEWGAPPYPTSSAEHRAAVVNAIETKSGRSLRNDGDVDSQLTEPGLIEGTYHVPYLAHATMEPMNAVAWLREDQLDIWAGNQNPGKMQHIGARMTGLPKEAVRVHTTYMGGGFGRRLEGDFIRIAVQAATAMRGVPVKVTWSREADMAHDSYRPLATARFRGRVVNGRPVALDLDLSSPSLIASSKRRGDEPSKKVEERLDHFSTAGAREQPYAIEHYRVTAYTAQELLPVGWWRGVGESQNVFFHESAIDELIHAAAGDALTTRLSMLTHAPSRAVLEQVAELSNWGTPLPAGHARGIAYALSSGAATAQVIEVSQAAGGIRIERIYAVVDVGVALDPRNIEAQVQSSIVFGLCAAMYGAITVTDGIVDQMNFYDYLVLRIHEVPPIEVGIYESGTSIFGVGESCTPTAPPALGNAIFALTGRRLRELPFGNTVKFV